MNDYLKDDFIDEVKGCLGKEGDGSGQANVIESIKVNGVDQSVDSNKSVDIPVPTKTSDLDNDSGYMTEDQVNNKVTEGVSSIVADAPEDFDTLKEMSDWLTQHDESAAAMNASIKKNADDITALQTSKADQEDVGEINSNLSSLGYKKAQFSLIDNKYITVEGDEASYNGWSATDYIDCTNGTKLCVYSPQMDEIKRYNCFYDSNKKFISNFVLEDGYSYIDIPTNASYLRMSGICNSIVKFVAHICSNLMAEVCNTKNDLEQLEYSDIAGGKNLLSESDVKNKSFTNQSYRFYELPINEQGYMSIIDKDPSISASGINVGFCKNIGDSSQLGSYDWFIAEGNISSYEEKHKVVKNNVVRKYMFFYPNTEETLNTIFNKYDFQLEKGDTPTPYEPYIPSVKMLVEENEQQSTEAMDLKMLGWTVPKECPIQNEVSGNQFIQKVGRVDLGSETSKNLSWTKYDGHGFNTRIAFTDVKPSGKCYMHDYPQGEDWEIPNAVSITGNNLIIITDDTYASVDAFLNAMSGKYLYYELETPITMQIDGHEAISKVNESLSALGKCKNLLNPTLQTTTKNGVTCTANGDGTYTLNGTANANTQFEIKARDVISKQIKLVGCPMSGSNTSYNIVVVNYNGSDIRDNGNGITIPTNTECAIRIYVESGTTLSNKVFKPMLTTNLNATYDDFVPYTGDGDTLTHDVAELKNDLDNYELFKVFLLGTSRGLPNVSSVSLDIDISEYKVVSAICYLQDGTIEQLSLKTDGNTIISASCHYGNITGYDIYGKKNK